MAQTAARRLTDDLFFQIIQNLVTLVEYLQQFNLLRANLDCHGCGRPMKLTEKDGKSDLFWKCTKKDCRKMKSVREGSEFLTYQTEEGKNSNRLPLAKIVQIIRCWAEMVPQTQAKDRLGIGIRAIAQWYEHCRDVCWTLLGRAEPMGGEGELVQIDESMFGGSGKYRRGRMLGGDRRCRKRKRDDDLDATLAGQDPEEIGDRNFGQQIGGKWVFSLCHWRGKENANEYRFIAVERRDHTTLLPIIQQHVKLGTTVFSDEWGAYKRLDRLRFEHLPVNHQHQFVDPGTLANTQAIEAIWGHLKADIMRSKKGVPRESLPKYLAEAWWCSLQRTAPGKWSPAIFESFLISASNAFPVQ